MFADGEKDVTDILGSLSLVVTQNNGPINEGGTIDATQPIKVRVSFDVPVENNPHGTGGYVNVDDWATFDISNAFSVLGLTTIDLKTDDSQYPTVGQVTLETDNDTGMVVARVTFSSGAFTDPGVTGVSAWFEADMSYKGEGDAGEVGDHTVQILDKTYIVNVPAAEITYSMTKEYTVKLQDGTIEWKVTIKATQEGLPVDIAGYKFSDNLTNVGTYKQGTFKVGNNSETPISTSPALTYTFPTGSTSPQVITFETEIAESLLNSDQEQEIPNTAQLLDNSGDQKAEGSITAKFTPKWITKSGVENNLGTGGNYDPKNRTITWTIEANPNGAELNNVVITDPMPTGLTFESAHWQMKENGAWGSDNTISPSDDKYTIGNITTPIRLIIVAKVPDADYVASVKNYTNRATITWTGQDEGFTGTGTVGVGYNPISKTGKLEMGDKSTNPKVKWTVTVNKRGQNFPSGLKVYDLLVYGKSSDFNINSVYGIPAGITLTDLTPRYGQKYDETSFTTEVGLTLNVIAITKNVNGESVRVADLLEISGFSGDVSKFSFNSVIVDPDFFVRGAKNPNQEVWNTATLFYGTTKLNSANNKVSVNNYSLRKEMLKRGTENPGTVGWANNSTVDATEAFDYVDKSVVFRLVVNADGLNLTGMENSEGQTLGDVMVTDTLPEGWEFVSFSENSNVPMFYAFKGTKSGTSSITASEGPITTDIDSQFSEDSNGNKTASFTFETLSGPYVILIKARPTDEKAVEYFNGNKTSTETNTVKLYAENWPGGITETRDVTIVSEVVGKGHLYNPQNPYVVEWILEYRPYDLQLVETDTEFEGLYITDSLPAGLEVRIDSQGKLLLGEESEAFIKVYEMVLGNNGEYTYTEDNRIDDLGVGQDVSYDNANRILRFNIREMKKAYRFSYITDVISDPGTKLENSASLMGIIENGIPAKKDFTVASSSGGGTLRRGGWLDIFKIDSEGTPLDGAEFSLYSQDGETVIRSGVSGADGKIRLGAIPEGEYILEETEAPAGYRKDKRIFHVKVEKDEDGIIVTTIDEASNELTVINYGENTGDLTLTKSVAGNAADKTKKFTFTITFAVNGDSDGGEYTYYRDGVPNGSISSGDEIDLAHGESITIVGLPEGTEYTIVENNYSSDGYSTMKRGDAGEIVADETQEALFTNIRNFEYESWVALQKVNEQGEALSGGRFGIYHADDKDFADPVKTAVADKGTVLFSGLEPGSYKIREIEAPEGYIKSDKVIDVVLGLSGSTSVAGVQVEEALVNTRAAGGIKLVKVDEKGEPLAGAVFELLDANKKVIKEGTSGKDGVIEFKALAMGTYYLREKTAPAGYAKLMELTEVVLKAGAEADMVKTVKLANHRNLASVTLRKTNQYDGVVSGGLFGIYKTDDDGFKNPLQKVASVKGMIIFTDLEAGQYFIREIEAPEDHKLTGEFVKVVLEVNPDTGLLEDLEIEKPLLNETPLTEEEWDEKVEGDDDEKDNGGKDDDLVETGGFLDTAMLWFFGTLLILAGAILLLRMRAALVRK